ncbi:MAG: nucleotide pyrophosphohydrolase [Candidatus Omnitrophica bacterium]|nr:nucleotide pyrophosphohydrolase [Candidatus Omnitrophota bacterium]
MTNKDDTTSVNDLKEMMKKFRDARDWGQFHTPKNLVQAMSIEANELMEEFLWKTDEEIEDLLKQDDFRQTVSYELADVMAFCLNFANVTNIDISQAMNEKMIHNQEKYPVEKSKGTATKYHKL